MRLSGLAVGATIGAIALCHAALPPDPEARDRLSALSAAVLASVPSVDPKDPGASANLALAKLHWERAERILGGEYADWDMTVEGELAAGEEALTRLRAGERPFGGTVGENLTLAYEAENDRSVQPYFLYVPRGYQAGVPTPLVVYLHGWVPGTTKLTPWLIGSSVFPILDEYGYLFLQPHGRGNTDFQGVGEADVLRTIEEVSRLYSVDPDRIYLAGNSMGGYGAYCIGLHHPDRFAAIGPACAQSDYYGWYGLSRQDVPAFKRAMYEMSNPFDLFPNARNLPVLIQHGGLDPLVSPQHARLADRELTRLGYEHQLAIVPTGPHEIYFEDSYFRRLFDFVKRRTRAVRPPHVTLHAYTLDAAQAYWLRVERIGNWGTVAEMDAAVEGDTLRVSASNVGAFGLRTADLGGMGVQRITVNGETWPLPTAPEAGDWASIELSPPPEGPLRKAPGLCGPIRTVFERPFLCVYGTAARDDTSEALLAGFTRDWWRFCEGLPMLVPPREGNWSPEWAIPDTAVTEEIERSHNLVLFGTPRENRYVAGIAERLPLGFTEDGYRIGESEYRGADLGLWFCCPNPRAPERMALSISGQPWGVGFQLVTRFSHRYDLLPDFILFDAGIDPDNCNHYRAAGFFGEDWRLREVDTEPPSPPPAP